jgi:hypothetical protein
MSIGEISVDVKAINEATSEFEAIAADAASMSSAISTSPLILRVQNLVSPELNAVADDAARLKAGVEASQVIINFAPIEVPSIPPIEVPPIEVPSLPPIDTTPIQDSISQVGMRAVEMGNEISDASSGVVSSFANVGAGAVEMGSQVETASSSFTDMQTHAEATMVSLRTVASGIRSFGMMGMELTTVARDFGMLDAQTAKYMRGLMAVITIVSTAARMYSFLTLMTTGQTAAVAVEGTTETATAGSISLSTVAHNIYATACGIATAAENALNISHATFLALTGVGIAVIIAAAAAVAVFASQMNSATASVNNYNAAASKVPTATKGIQRAQEQNMLRRGVE